MKNNVAENISKEIQKYTPQLYYDEKPNSNLPSRPLASSVLITVDDHYFLITAGHTFEDVDLMHIGILIEAEFCTIGGALTKYEPNNEHYEPNKLDISIFHLDLETIKMFKEKYKFLEWNQIVFNHYSSHNSRYMLFGYPAEITRKHFPTKKIIPAALPLITIGLPPENYCLGNIDIHKKLILLLADFISLKTKSIKKLPELEGISGGGVWLVSDDNEKTQYQLVGIVTGQKDSFMFSTKMDFLFVLTNLI